MDGKKETNLETLAYRTYGQSIAQRFYFKTIASARSGVLGSIKTKHSQIRASFEKIVTFLPNKLVPVFLFGEAGTGKSRIVRELFSLQSFYQRLNNREVAKLRVTKGEYLAPGFSINWEKTYSSGDLVYIDSVEGMSMEAQAELLELIRTRGNLIDNEMDAYRIAIGSSVALSLQVVKGSFLRALLKEISELSVYLPSLSERSEDLPEIIMDIVEEMTGKRALPRAEVMDLFDKIDWPQNIDDLKKLLASLVSYSSNPSEWGLEAFPASFKALLPAHLLGTNDPLRAKMNSAHRERIQFRSTLIQFGGSYEEAARFMGISKTSFIQKLMSLGVR